MFYITALALYPALLVLVVPIGLALVGLVAGDAQEEGEVRTALAPIVGLAALSVIISLLLHLRAPASMLVPTAVALNLAALAWLCRRPVENRVGRFKPRLLAVLLLTGWLAYLVLSAPLLIAGRFGVLGYQVNHDPIFHSIMPEYLDSHGYDFPGMARDAFTEGAVSKFIGQGYPDAWHQFLLLAMRLFGRRAFALLNFVEAFYVALVAPVAYAWLRRARVISGWAVFGGFVAATGYIQLSYLFQGFAPQVAIVPFIYACLLSFYLVLIEGRLRWAPLAALFLQVSLAVYSFTILIWLMVFLVIILAYRSWLTRSLTGLKVEIAAIAAIGSIAMIINPFVLTGIGAAFTMVTDFSAGEGMGNLVSRHVPILPVFGIWPAQDHRVVPLGWLHLAAYLGAAFVIAVVVIGLRAGSGRPLLWILAATVAIPAVILKISASPYYFAKTLHIAAPVAAMTAAAGFNFIWTSGRRRLAVYLAAIYILGLAASDALPIKFTPITPEKQFAELSKINNRFKGRKRLTLFVEAHEDWGEYLLGSLLPVAPFSTLFRGGAVPVEWAPGSPGVKDIDSLEGVISRKYSLLVIAKGQDVSLPPPPFESAFVGRFYNVYRAGPWPRRGDVISHRPFETMRRSMGAAFLELRPGEKIELTLKDKFRSLLVSGYFVGPETKSIGVGAVPITFSVGRRQASISIKQVPQVYALPFAGDSGVALRVRNTATVPLRLDWIETLRRPHDQAALFRYNDKNKHVFRSASRIDK